MIELRVERTIAAAPERVFDWLADPKGLTAAPLVLGARLAKGSSELKAGAVRTVTGAGMWFEEEYTTYDPPRSYSYLILRSVPGFVHDGGTLTFTPADTGTHVEWVTRYTHPLWSGGKAFEPVSSRLLRWNFRAILDGCAKALETT
ncbi:MULTISPECIES: SRPBCC family protein [unclassified Mycobacterium]|uniref:SRPBCC family protein n=1 Tax=unclassified Mycobacterium TaxID=2642494 RepID=UPI000801D1AC|nr:MULTISPECIES: SRPBCC family protein [unclassified Mycobacterium]OBB40243.1 polyketide cyclase [Mycobacterium sp. 852002-51961_SCH5331710]OBG99006.1 polyketide cyclase [Mycobacterium sp. E136]